MSTLGIYISRMRQTFLYLTALFIVNTINYVNWSFSVNQHILLWFPKCFVFFTTHGRLCFLVEHDLLCFPGLLLKSTHFIVFSGEFLFYRWLMSMLLDFICFTVISKAYLGISTFHCFGGMGYFASCLDDAHAFGLNTIYCGFRGLTWNQHTPL